MPLCDKLSCHCNGDPPLTAIKIRGALRAYHQKMAIDDFRQIPAEALVTLHRGLHPETLLIFLALLLAMSGLLFWGAGLMLRLLRRRTRFLGPGG